MYSVLRIYEVVIDGIGYSNDGIMGMMHTLYENMVKIEVRVVN